MIKKRKPGRPLRGGVKRVKFTPSVLPSTLEWIKKQEASQGQVIDRLVKEESERQEAVEENREDSTKVV